MSIVSTNMDYFLQERTEMLKYIPTHSKKILDIGCGSGAFGIVVKKRQKCEVWGVELNKEVGLKAKSNLDKVLIGDVMILCRDLPEKYFDCIVLNDIIEHLVDPYTLLLDLKSKLTNDGVIVCSIPNIRYFFVFKDLIFAKQWRYKEFGVLDKTHLRFFTYKSLREMFAELKFDIIQMEGIHPIVSWKFTLLNIISLNYLDDTRFAQFAISVKPSKY